MKDSIIDKFGRRLGELEVKYPKRFIWALFFITILMLPGLLQMKIEPSLEKVLPQDLEVLKKMNYMRDQFGADMVYLFFDVDGSSYDDVRLPEIIKQIEVTEQKALYNQNILSINSVTTMIREYNGGVIPEDYIRIKEIFNEARIIGDPRVNLVSYDNSIIISEIKTNTGADAPSIARVVTDLKNDLTNSNNLDLKVGLTGYNALDKATFEVIISDFSYTTFIAFAFVGIVVYLTFNSLIKGMIPMVVVMISLLWTNGTVGYLGIPVTVVSMGAAAMVMGLGIDFGIHMLSYFKEMRDIGKSIKEAIVLTVEKDILAIVGTSVTTMAGFLSLWFSALPAMADLGSVLLLGIFYSMVAALLGMMPMLYFYERKQERKLALKNL